MEREIATTWVTKVVNQKISSHSTFSPDKDEL